MLVGLVAVVVVVVLTDVVDVSVPAVVVVLTDVVDVSVPAVVVVLTDVVDVISVEAVKFSIDVGEAVVVVRFSFLTKPGGRPLRSDCGRASAEELTRAGIEMASKPRRTASATETSLRYRMPEHRPLG